MFYEANERRMVQTLASFAFPARFSAGGVQELGCGCSVSVSQRAMYHADALLYRENERAEVQLGVMRHLPHEANLFHVHFNMQVRCVCQTLPTGHLESPSSLLSNRSA
jgi:hypothetical protein